MAEGGLPGAGLALLRAMDAVDAEEAKAGEDDRMRSGAGTTAGMLSRASLWI